MHSADEEENFSVLTAFPLTKDVDGSVKDKATQAADRPRKSWRKTRMVETFTVSGRR